MRRAEIPHNRSANSSRCKPQPYRNPPCILFGRLTCGTHRQVSAAVLGKPLGVKLAESIGIGSQWPQIVIEGLGPSPAALEHFFDKRLEEDHAGAGAS